MKKFKIWEIEYLNNILLELNKQWAYYIEDRKCNFDVEIGTQILLDMHGGKKKFVLLSWDSDFADIISNI